MLQSVEASLTPLAARFRRSAGDALTQPAASLPRSAGDSTELRQARTTGRLAPSSPRSKGGHTREDGKTGTSCGNNRDWVQCSAPSILASTSTRYKLPRLAEFPILPKQPFKFILHFFVVGLMKLSRQSIRLLAY